MKNMMTLMTIQILLSLKMQTDNLYLCSNCGHEGPAYGIPTSSGVSAPFCQNCQRNDKLYKVGDKDLHKLRASIMFNVEYDNVTEVQRGMAKEFCFFKNYGGKSRVTYDLDKAKYITSKFMNLFGIKHEVKV